MNHLLYAMAMLRVSHIYYFMVISASLLRAYLGAENLVAIFGKTVLSPGMPVNLGKLEPCQTLQLYFCLFSVQQLTYRNRSRIGRGSQN